MGTRADFYVGRGVKAEWLGSIAWDGYPDGIDKQLLNCTSEAAYRHAVTEFLNDREDKTLPEQGWPWPWDDSRTTDYAYAFEAGAVHASSFGHTWFDPNLPQPEGEPDEAVFPDMSKGKQRAKFGAHSGIMVIGARERGG